ncbi:MAG TPA: PadR family transcriptional regulator [Haliangiales bacterium]|nr:PadR family transcriptional regulator [Haliangiales bacterium]
MAPPSTEDLLPLTPATFHILLVLAAGESHGYAIMAEVERLTGGRVHVGPGTLYRSVYRMLVDGLIERTDPGDQAPADERRSVYRLTRLGREAARAEARRLHALVEAARARGLLDDRAPRRRGGLRP